MSAQPYSRASLEALRASTCPRCCVDLRDCTCPGGLRSRSFEEVAAESLGVPEDRVREARSRYVIEEIADGWTQRIAAIKGASG